MFKYPFLTTIIGWNFLLYLIGLFLPDLPPLFALSYPAGGVSPLASAILDAFRLVSYTFAHTGLSHLLLNMLWVLMLGLSLHDRISPRRLLALYIGSGAIGGLFFLLSALIWDTSIPVSLYGASCAVGGLCGGIFIIRPDVKFPRLRLNFNLSYPLALLGIIISLISASNPYSLIAHIGGIAGGFILAWLLTSTLYNTQNSEQQQ